MTSQKSILHCNNGTCAGIMGNTGCCFECEWFDNCLPEIKCDDRAGFDAGTCLGREEQ